MFGWYFADRTVPVADVVSQMAKLPMAAQPGEQWVYGYNTDILGVVVEKLSGQSLDAFFKQRLIDPLGMVDTAFQVAEDKAHRLAANYLVVDGEVQLLDDPQRSPFLRPPKFMMGGGGLTGTVADYVRFCEMLRRGGEPSGINRIYRLYREEGLTVRKRRARRKAVGTRAPILVEARPNARWSLDFVHDQLACGRRFRILNVVVECHSELTR